MSRSGLTLFFHASPVNTQGLQKKTNPDLSKVDENQLAIAEHVWKLPEIIIIVA